jgi:hypothetical protein
MLSTIAEIIRDLLIFVGVIADIAVVVLVSKMPNTNPLKRVIASEPHWRQELSRSR